MKKEQDSSADKVLQLLEAFLESNFAPMAVSEIMEKSGLKRHSTDRLLKVLEAKGYVVKAQKNKWMLGTKILRYAENYSEYCLKIVSSSI